MTSLLTRIDNHHRAPGRRRPAALLALCAAGALGVCLGLAAPRAAHAQEFTLTLTPSTPAPVTVAPGQSVSFLATLTNGGTESIELFDFVNILSDVNDAAADPSASYTVDDNGFLDALAGQFPDLVIPGGGGSVQGNVTLNLLSGLPDGVYSFTYTVSGVGTTSNSPRTTSGSVDLIVTSAPSGTAPEPGAAALLASVGVPALAAVARRRRRAGAN